MLTHTSKKITISDPWFYQFLIDTIKQHCAIYNIAPLSTPLLEENGSLRTEAYDFITKSYQTGNQKQTPLKVFTHGPIFEQKNNIITPIDTFTIAAININTAAYDAYLIKMLDVLFGEILKLEDYVLKLNVDSYAQQELLLETLSFHSVNYLIDQKLTNHKKRDHTLFFEFTTKDLGDKNSFCRGLGWREEATIGTPLVSIGAEINLDALDTLAQNSINKLNIPQKRALHVIIPANQEQNNVALFLAYELQAHGLAADILMESTTLDQRLAIAQQLGAKHILVVEADDIQPGTICVQNKHTNSKATVKQADIVQFLLGR